MKTTITLVAIINLLVLCNLWITASACPENSSDSEIRRKRYESWLKEYARKYGNKDQWEVHFEIYRVNVHFIEVYNSQKLCLQAHRQQVCRSYKCRVQMYVSGLSTYVAFADRIHVPKTWGSTKKHRLEEKRCSYTYQGSRPCW